MERRGAGSFFLREDRKGEASTKKFSNHFVVYINIEVDGGVSLGENASVPDVGGGLDQVSIKSSFTFIDE